MTYADRLHTQLEKRIAQTADLSTKIGLWWTLKGLWDSRNSVTMAWSYWERVKLSAEPGHPAREGYRLGMRLWRNHATLSARALHAKKLAWCAEYRRHYADRKAINAPYYQDLRSNWRQARADAILLRYSDTQGLTPPLP